MPSPAYQTSNFAFQGAGQFAYQTDDGEQNCGGWDTDFEESRQRRLRRKRLEDERKQQADELQEELDRNLAQLLYEQEQKDAERKDLERLQALSDALMRERTNLPRPILASVMKAHEERTRNALLQLERMIAQMLDEEEAAIIALLLIDD